MPLAVGWIDGLGVGNYEKDNEMAVGDPRESAAACMAASPRDWSLDHRDAWLWGIVCGWGEEALHHLAKKHNWNENTVSRLCELRKSWELMTPNV